MDLEFSTVKRMMLDHGVQRMFVKQLSPNDNSKNQPYFGPDPTAVAFLPSGETTTTQTRSRKEKTSNVKFLTSLNFAWLNDNGSLELAPHAKLIFYPQYPEVRFSGFLRGCNNGPNELFDSKKRGREPGRILLLGVSNNNQIIGYVSAGDASVAKEITSLRLEVTQGVFAEISLDRLDESFDARAHLLAELCRISKRGWIESKRLLSDGTEVPYEATNGGGFTIEAELGITPNGYSEPDFHGWEVKQYSVRDFGVSSSGRVTLMTPEPNGGYYKDKGVESFVLKYGYSDLRGRDRKNFCGVHKSGVRHMRTGLTLIMPGFDAAESIITDAAQGIVLIDDEDNVAAQWGYASIIEHWKRKHAQAVYVPSNLQKLPNVQYRYSNDVRLGIGTGVKLLLNAVAKGTVVYDPGVVMKNASTSRRPIKRRSQFRVAVRDLPILYESFVSVDACAPLLSKKDSR